MRDFVLHDEELVLLIRMCRDHQVAYYLTCHKAYKLLDLGFDPSNGRRFHQCPSCGASTDDALRAHLVGCPSVRAEEAAGRAEVIKKVTMVLVDRSRVMIAESEDRTYRARRSTARPPAPEERETTEA